MIDAILNGKWKRDPDHENIILGEWFEDNFKYEIKCPPQLRDEIIEMQNHFANMYRLRGESMQGVRKFDHELFHPVKFQINT